MSTVSRIATLVMGVLVGAVFGTAGTMMYSSLSAPTVFSAEQPVPIGFLVSFIACTALLIGLRLLSESRWLAILGGIGMYAAVMVFAQRGPGGSVLLPANALSMTWILSIAAVILLVVAWPRIQRQPARPVSAAPADDPAHIAR